MNMPTHKPFSTIPLDAMTKGIICTAGASLCYATELFIASQLVVGHAPAMLIASSEALLGLVFLSMIRGRALIHYAVWLKNHMSKLHWAILAGLAHATALGSFFAALSHAPLSVIAPFGSIGPLIAYSLVLVLLRGTDRVTRRAVLGVGLVVIGVTLIGVYNV